MDQNQKKVSPLQIALIGFFLTFSCLHPLPLEADQRITSDTIAEFNKIVEEKSRAQNKKNILLVYDLDNTLLAMKQDLGSDQWFTWQTALLKNNKTENLVAPNLEALLHLQYVIFALGKMQAVESQTSQKVLELQSKGYNSIVLTSRGPQFRGDTEMELINNGMNFKQTQFGPPLGYPGEFFPEGIPSPREASYMNGIAMGSGMHKGQFLKALINKNKADIKLVFFMDDTLKNIEHMEETMGPMVELYTFHYTHEEPRVKAFEKDKSQAIKSWLDLKQLLKEDFSP